MNAGSALVHAPERWLVRVQRKGDPCFYGTNHADKLVALDAYNARVGTHVAVKWERVA